VTQSAIINATVDGVRVSLSTNDEEMTITYDGQEIKAETLITEEFAAKLASVVDRVFRAVNDGVKVDGVTSVTTTIAKNNSVQVNTTRGGYQNFIQGDGDIHIYT
jgi:hypothetical protein